MNKNLICGLLAVFAVAGLGVPAFADDYPARPITMIVPYPPGGPSDVVARIMADGMSRALNGSIVIENVGGAGGTIGTARAAEAAGDGYTLLGASMGSHVAAPSLYKNLRYDSRKDFVPIGLASNAPAVVVARKDFPAKDLKEFIAYLKANGDKVKQAEGGVGSSSYLACLQFTTAAGVNPTLVGYRGTGPALNDLIGGHVDFFCEQAVSVQGAIKGGTVKAYVVSGDQRLSAIPDVPSAKEAGLPGYNISVWSAIFAPKGTPKPVVSRLAEALNKTLDDPATVKRLHDLGGTVPPKRDRGLEPLAERLKEDIAIWHPLLTKAAVKMQDGK